MKDLGVQPRIRGQNEGFRDIPRIWDQDQGFGVTAGIQGHSWDLGNSDLDSGVPPWIWGSLSGSRLFPGSGALPRFSHLLLLVLALIVAQEGFGASPPPPSAPALPTLWNLLLSAQTDLHLH